MPKISIPPEILEKAINAAVAEFLSLHPTMHKVVVHLLIIRLIEILDDDGFPVMNAGATDLLRAVANLVDIVKGEMKYENNS